MPHKPVPEDDFRLLTLEEVGDRLAMSRNSIDKYVKTGRLRAFKTKAGWRIEWTEFQRFYKELTAKV